MSAPENLDLWTRRIEEFAAGRPVKLRGSVNEEAQTIVVRSGQITFCKKKITRL